MILQKNRTEKTLLLGLFIHSLVKIMACQRKFYNFYAPSLVVNTLTVYTKIGILISICKGKPLHL